MTLTRRRDGRNDNQIRPLAAEQGILNRADGSARFLQGNTSVLAAVYGPAPAKVARMEKADRATVDVNFKPESGITSPADAERELLLRRSLEEVVLRSRYPRCVVSVVIQVRAGSILFRCVFVSAAARSTYLGCTASCRDPFSGVFLARLSVCARFYATRAML